MAVPFNDLHRAYTEQQEDISSVVQAVLNRGRYVMGPEHERFEQGFAEHLGIAVALGVASGTDALILIFKALAQRDAEARQPVTPGRVISAANAGGYTASAATLAGLRCEFIDVETDSHCLDPRQLNSALERDADGVVAVVATHLYGRMADTPAIAAICKNFGVPLVEDCAQATGARAEGRAAGSFGTAAAFSFYPTKNLGALGDGGAIASGDRNLVERIIRLRQYGWGTKYRQVVPGGMNSRLDELQAAVLNVRLPRLNAWNQRRRDIVAAYRTAAKSAGLEVLPAADESHAAHLAVVVTERRNKLRRYLEKLGIGCEIHYPIPDHHQPAIRAADLGNGPILTVTECLADRVLSVPCFPQLRDDEIDEVCDALARF